jgi:glutamate synthase domain-containing protein 3
MTGGRVVVIGPTGRNFAAGMSGGIAYVYDDRPTTFPSLCNQDMVSLSPPENDEDVQTIRRLLENHVKYTGSQVAQAILDNWDTEIHRFVKVMPNDYRRVLANKAEQAHRAELLARTQPSDGDGTASAGETLVNAAVKKGGSDVGTGNRG